MDAQNINYNRSLFDQHYGDCNPIAIIGMGCRFPDASDPFTFWRRLCNGEKFTRSIDRDALLKAGLDPSLYDRADYVASSSVVDEAEFFDAEFFGYTPGEAASIDPQQRVFLTCAWEALDMAGQTDATSSHRIGVYGSARMSTYVHGSKEDILHVSEPATFQKLLGNDKDYIASRVAYKLGLNGPAVTIQTACSSSLVAIHSACEALRSGEVDMTIAGGAALSFPMGVGYIHRPGMIFSDDGECRPYDENANGTFMGNGVGVALLKPLEDALRDGDPIIAVVRSTAVNNDGSQKAGFTAPSVSGQRSVVEEAIALADIEPSQIGLVEGHGTATPLGDPIEVEALNQAFGTTDPGKCALGSLKSNAGHLDTAAGIAAFFKAALATRYGLIPPSLGFSKVNSAIQIEETPFFVPQVLLPWSDENRIAGVSSFGIGGTNSHAIIENLPAGLRAFDAIETDEAFLTISAGSEKALRRLATIYADHLLDCEPPEGLHNYCATASTARKKFDFELKVSGTSSSDIASKLLEFGLGSEAQSTRDGNVTHWLFGENNPEVPRVQHLSVAPSGVLLGKEIKREQETVKDPQWETIKNAAGESAQLRSEEHDWSGLADEQDAVSVLHKAFVGKAFLDLDLFLDPSHAYSLDDVMEKGNIQPQMRQLTARMLQDLAMSGALTQDNGIYSDLCDIPDDKTVVGLIDQVRAAGYERLASLAERAGPNLAAMMSGDLDPISIIFPSGDTDDVEEMYEAQRDSIFLNTIAADTVREIVNQSDKTKTLRFLEIGAGTGGTTSSIIPLLDPDQSEYTFTDISPLFLHRAKKKFADYPFLNFKTYNIDNDPWQQGFERESFDVIVAANVIHNARDLREHIAELHELLAPGGVLVLREIAERKPLFDMIFGPIAPQVDDLEWRQGEFFPSLKCWHEGFENAGFCSSTFSPSVGSACDRLGEYIMLARKKPIVASGASATQFNEGVSVATSSVAAILRSLVSVCDTDTVELSNIQIIASDKDMEAHWHFSDNQVTLKNDEVTFAQARLSNQFKPDEEPEKLASADHTVETQSQLFDKLVELTDTKLALRIHRLVLFEAMSGNGFSVSSSSGVVGTDFAIAQSNGWSLLRIEGWQAISSEKSPITLYHWEFERLSELVGLPDNATTNTNPDLYLTFSNNVTVCEGVNQRVWHSDIKLDKGNQVLLDLSQESGIETAEFYTKVSQVLEAVGSAQASLCCITRNVLPAVAWQKQGPAEFGGLYSLLQVVAGEYPDAQFKMLDLDNHESALEGWHKTRSEFQNENTLVLRNGKLLVQRLEKSTCLSDQFHLRADGIYILVGGLSKLALMTAKKLVDAGAHHIWLVARREPDSEESRTIKKLRKHGAEVRLFNNIDIAKPKQAAKLKKALDKSKRSVAGVLHLAGALQDGPISTSNCKQFRNVLKPKLKGTRNLIEVLNGQKLDFLVFYSSAATVFGPPGQAAHAVANGILETLVCEARAAGLPALAVAWGMWDDGRKERRELVRVLNDRGMLEISPEEGWDMLATAIANGAAIQAAMSVDWSRLKDRATYGRPEFERFDQLKTPKTNSATKQVTDVSEKILNSLSKLLGYQVCDIDPDENLIRLGMDSLMMLDLSEQLKEMFNVEMSAEAAMESDTANKLITYVKAQVAQNEDAGVDIKEALRFEISELLKIPAEDISDDANLVQLGIDSLMLLDLGERAFERFGFRMSAETAMAQDTLAGLASAYKAEMQGSQAEEKSALRTALDELGEGKPDLFLANGDLKPNRAVADFELPEYQKQWLEGRQDDMPLGGAARHLYVEYDKSQTDFDVSGFEKAWNNVVSRHSALRSSIDASGKVTVRDDVSYYEINQTDLRELSDENREEFLESLRKELSCQHFDLKDWPAFDLRVSLLPDDLLRLHIDIDTTLIDIESFQIILREIGSLMSVNGRKLPALSFGPADYYRGVKLVQGSSVYKEQQEFAAKRAHELNPAPALPLLTGPVVDRPLLFEIERDELPRDTWLKFKQEGEKRGIKPSELMLAIYTTVLSEHLVKTDPFCISLLHFDRKPLNAGAMNTVIDASIMMPVNAHPANSESFAALCEVISSEIQIGLKHDLIDGTQLLAKNAASEAAKSAPQLLLPVGFTSLLGVRRAYAVPETPDPTLGMPSYEYASQPQMMLHFQALEEESALLFNLDWAKYIIPDDLCHSMMNGMRKLMSLLASQPDIWESSLSQLFMQPEKFGKSSTLTLDQWLVDAKHIQ